jgi:hypothetical protein
MGEIKSLFYRSIHKGLPSVRSNQVHAIETTESKFKIIENFSGSSITFMFCSYSHALHKRAHSGKVKSVQVLLKKLLYEFL